MKSQILKKNISFLLPIICLLIISLLDMYGAKAISPLYKNAFKRQLLWIFLSIIAFIGTYKINFRLLYKKINFFYIIGLISLILVLFCGSTINGASSWFKIGAFSIQPSEIVKFFFIIALAKMITNEKSRGFWLFIKIILFSIIPSILIFLEPDTGVVIMYLLIMFGELVASKIKKKYLILTIGGSLTLVGSFLILYLFKREFIIDIVGSTLFYRIDRLLSFKNNSSYQLTNALIGIGASGSRGFGLFSSKIYVPEIITDFVFDLTIINFGYVLGMIVIFLYTIILINLYREINKTHKEEWKCILSGIFWLMLFQTFEHIFMNIGLTPITGITLPFLSYGGSSLLSYSMIFALVLKITTNNSSYN